MKKKDKYEEIAVELAMALKGLAELIIIGNYDAMERKVRLLFAANVLKRYIIQRKKDGKYSPSK